MDTSPPLPLHENCFQRLHNRLAASRFFTFSLLLHVILVILAGSVVLFRHEPDLSNFEPPGGSLVSEDSAPQPPPPESIPPDSLTPPPPVVVGVNFEVVATPSPLPTTFVMPTGVASIKGPPPTLNSVVRLSVPVASGLNRLPPSMLSRVGGPAHTAAMQQYKMTPKSEQAVLAGLKWLKEHQNEDGSWGAKFPTAMTGLAALCFLGHGETPEAQDFGPTVKKGIDWLLGRGLSAEGALAGKAGHFSSTDVYEHAIGAYALCEYYTMTRDDRVKDVLTQAITYIVTGQAPDGGWSYSYVKNEDSDTSVSGWQMQALKAAHLTGLNIVGIDEALDKAMLNLKRVQGASGGFGYHTPEQAKYSLTGIGVLCTYVWKGEKDRVVREGLKYILEKTEKENPVEYQGPKADLYAWYYNTQACMMVGGEAWTKWNHWFQGQITDHQSADGSWPVTGNPKPIGSLESDPAGGQVYRTTLSVLMLEVYYRYMPYGK